MTEHELTAFFSFIRASIDPESLVPEAGLTQGRVLAGHVGLGLAHLDLGEMMLAEVEREIIMAILDSTVPALHAGLVLYVGDKKLGQRRARYAGLN